MCLFGGKNSGTEWTCLAGSARSWDFPTGLGWGFLKGSQKREAFEWTGVFGRRLGWDSELES